MALMRQRLVGPTRPADGPRNPRSPCGVLHPMALTGTYEPSPSDWVREQVEKFEASNGQEGAELNGDPIVVITSTGAKSGNLRKNPVMRVEHDGTYVAIASKGGAPDQPEWYFNFLAHPEVELQDGSEKHTYVARRRRGRGAGRVVGARRRHVVDVRRVPGEDRPGDPGLPARTRLTGRDLPRRRLVDPGMRPRPSLPVALAAPLLLTAALAHRGPGRRGARARRARSTPRATRRTSSTPTAASTAPAASCRTRRTCPRWSRRPPRRASTSCSPRWPSRPGSRSPPATSSRAGTSATRCAPAGRRPAAGSSGSRSPTGTAPCCAAPSTGPRRARSTRTPAGSCTRRSRAWCSPRGRSRAPRGCTSGSPRTWPSAATSC